MKLCFVKSRKPGMYILDFVYADILTDLLIKRTNVDECK